MTKILRMVRAWWYHRRPALGWAAVSPEILRTKGTWTPQGEPTYEDMTTLMAAWERQV